MVSFVFYLFYIILINGQSEFYVTSDGTVNQDCKSTQPCGSLAIALRNIENSNVISNQDIKIYVNGHYSQPFDSNIDCHSQIHGNITIIFDRNTIQSTNDWFPHINKCYNLNKQRALYQLYGDGSSIDFHHLIYQHTSALFIHTIDNSIGDINCYHCIFSNLYITQNNTNSFISLYHSSRFINCLFENITIQSNNNQYSVAFIAASVYVDNAVIVMHNSKLNNIITLDSNTYFISIEPHISHYITMNINNISYNVNSISVSRFIYANTDSKFVNSNNKISLISSSFTGSINILYINQGIFDVNMYDINIQTPQHIIHTQTNGNILYLNTIHIGEDSTLNMNNINFKTLLLCHTNDQLIPNGNTRPSILCEIPIGFLYNAGHCYMQNIKMDSSYDLSDYDLNKYSGIQYIDLIDMDLSNSYHMVGIYNDEGDIHINNILFLNGANYQFLYNLRGTVVINTFHTIDNTINNNINDIWNLKPTHLFVNYGHLNINNSYIIGCTHIGFQLYHGTLYISNSIISYLPSLIQSMYTIDSIQLYSNNISNINNPIYISSHDISITYCTFNIVSQFIFSTIGLMESDAAKLQYIQKRNIFIDHNEFESINNLNVSVNGFMEIYSPYSIHLTNNIFGNDIYYSNIPWIYLQTSMYDNCMSSNTFYDNALFIQNGSIISCKYPTISPFMDEDNKCWTSFGTPNREYSDISVFIYINSLISITMNASSNLILDYIQFRDYKQTPIQIIGKNNSLSIFNGLFNNNNNIPLQIPYYCSSKCYEIVNNNHQQIRQLRLICDTKILNNNIIQPQSTDYYIGIDKLSKHDNTLKSVSSWLPHHIYLTSDGAYPGGKMLIDYIILDIYNNTVEDYNIFFPNDIQIQLFSNEIYMDNILYINTNNNLCDICIDGIDISSYITTDNIGNIYLIQTYVLYDLLLVNNLSINIIHCPENYIISNGSLCIDPSLLPKKESRIEMSVWIVVISISVFLIISIIIYFMCRDSKKKKSIIKTK
eukprot:219310_1